MQQNMTAGPILPVILRFTLPLFAGNIFQQFYNMADTIIVGRCLGAQALAAVGATSTVSFCCSDLRWALRRASLS